MTKTSRTSRATRLVFLVLLALAGLNAVPLGAQSPPLDGFDAYVRQAVDDWEVPGLAVAVVKDGRTVFAKGYGVRTLGADEAVDTRTLFAIGSTTKAMTAALVGMLIDEGKLSWDDPVVRHLPSFQVADPYVTREITVRDLLAHRTGVGNSDFLWYEQENTTAQILGSMRFISQAASLRSAFIYQNVMYTAAGEIAARLSGTTWPELLRTRLLEPLGMTGTQPTAAELEAQPNVASPHDRIEGTIEVIENASVDPVAPAGSVWSSVEDMSKWIRFLLNVCVTESGERLLSQATCQELFMPQTIVQRANFYPTARLTRPHWTTYSLGWFQADYQGRAVDFHTGSIDGMVAIAGMVRDEALGIYVLANLDHAELRHALMYRVLDLYGGAEPRDWSGELRELYGSIRASVEAADKKMEDERVAGAGPSLALERYAGRYVHDAYGTLEVTFDDGSLRMKLGKLGGELEHWHYDTFRVRFDDAWRGRIPVSFVLDVAGKPSVLDVEFARFERSDDEPDS